MKAIVHFFNQAMHKVTVQGIQPLKRKTQCKFLLQNNSHDLAVSSCQFFVNCTHAFRFFEDLVEPSVGILAAFT